MSTNKDLLKQAIAEAKTIREAAIANAKEALEESLTPHLKEMLAQKLQEMEIDEEEDKMMDETIYEAEEKDEEPTEDENEQRKGTQLRRSMRFSSLNKGRGRVPASRVFVVPHGTVVARSVTWRRLSRSATHCLWSGFSGPMITGCQLRARPARSIGVAFRGERRSVSRAHGTKDRHSDTLRS